MEPERKSAVFRHLTNLVRKFRDKAYRDSYVATHIRTFLAHQIRSLRGDMSQEAFGKLIGKPQNVVSRLENPDYGKVTLQTLLDIAAKLDVALLVRFVDFPTFLRGTRDMSDEAARPASYDYKPLDDLARHEEIRLALIGNAGSQTITFSISADGGHQETIVPPLSSTASESIPMPIASTNMNLIPLKEAANA